MCNLVCFLALQSRYHHLGLAMAIREGRRGKNLLLFGHCQNRLDPPSPPGFLDTYEELLMVPQTIWIRVRPPTPPLDNVQIEADFFLGLLP